MSGHNRFTRLVGGTAVALAVTTAVAVQASAGDGGTLSTPSALQTDGTTTTMMAPDGSLPPRPDVPPEILSSSFQGMSGTDGRIARLYAAFFLRDPDSAGFSFWQEKIAAGDWTNDDAASFFSNSPEFNSLYGSDLSDEQYVQLLYQNTLSRLPDAGGLAFWLDRLQAQGWSRGAVALGFSDSPEFKTLTKTS